MAMELEFWLPDGPNGERLEFAKRVSAWEILPCVERYRRADHAYIVLRHTSRQRGEWCVWVNPRYTSGTAPCVGPLEGG